MQTKIDCTVLVYVNSDETHQPDIKSDRTEPVWSVFIGSADEVEIDLTTLTRKQATELADGIAHALRLFDKYTNQIKRFTTAD